MLRAGLVAIGADGIPHLRLVLEGRLPRGLPVAPHGRRAPGRFSAGAGAGR